MEMSKKLILAVVGLSLGACSSMGEKEPFLTYEDLQAKVREHDGLWQSVQPKLDKIDALEAEIAELKQDKMALNDTVSIEDTSMATDSAMTEMSMSENEMAATNVAPMVSPVVESAPMAAEEMKPMVEEIKQTNTVNAAPMATAPLTAEPTVASKSEYGVQLASYANRDEAIRGWRVLLKNDPVAFNGLEPLVNQKEVNGRDMYQLKVGPFINKSFSSDFCEMLKEKGKGCFVTQYNGDVFTQN